MPSTIHPQLGQEIIPGYRLRAILGKGGYGEVWDAVGPGGRPFALKLVPLAEKLAGPDLRSLQMLPFLRHPSLLEVHGIHVAGGHLIVVMERAHGTLADLLRETMHFYQVALERSEVLGWLADVALGLDYLNEAGTTPDGLAKPAISHRDIKPQNILLVGNGVKIGDFGLARVLEQSATAHSGAMTPAFAPPEFFGGHTTRSSDQYSLAVMYVQLVSGKLPFVGSPAEIMHGHMENPPDLSMLPEREQPVVGRALAKDPGQRWPTCEAFVSALSDVAHTPEFPGVDFLSPPSVKPTVRDSVEVATRADWIPFDAPPPPRSRRIPTLIALIVIAVLGAGIAWLATRSDEEPTPPPAPVRAEAGRPATIDLALHRPMS